MGLPSHSGGSPEVRCVVLFFRDPAAQVGTLPAVVGEAQESKSAGNTDRPGYRLRQLLSRRPVVASTVHRRPLPLPRYESVVEWQLGQSSRRFSGRLFRQSPSMWSTSSGSG